MYIHLSPPRNEHNPQEPTGWSVCMTGALQTTLRCRTTLLPATNFAGPSILQRAYAPHRSIVHTHSTTIVECGRIGPKFHYIPNIIRTDLVKISGSTPSDRTFFFFFFLACEQVFRSFLSLVPVRSLPTCDTARYGSFAYYHSSWNLGISGTKDSSGSKDQSA
jgi:hypothetical protein